jgi:hypothetical protein
MTSLMGLPLAEASAGLAAFWFGRHEQALRRRRASANKRAGSAEKKQH